MRDGTSNAACPPLAPFLLAGAACHHDGHLEHARPKLLVTSPTKRHVDLQREYVAQIRAHQHIELRAIEHGYLQDTFVDEGERVANGRKMFQLLPVVYRAEVQEAEAEVERAGIEFTNTRMLAEKNIVSPQELALSKANLSKAQAHLTLATTHRGLTVVRAPLTDIMGRFHARRGSLIDEGDLLRRRRAA